jgi:putative transposase
VVATGYRRVHVLLRREGWQVNHIHVYRLYRLEGLSLRLKMHKKRVSKAWTTRTSDVSYRSGCRHYHLRGSAS